MFEVWYISFWCGDSESKKIFILQKKKKFEQLKVFGKERRVDIYSRTTINSQWLLYV